MNQEIREDFRTGFSRSQAGGSPTPPTSGDQASPTPPGSPAPNRGWWRPSNGGRPRGLWAGVILIALGAYFLLANVGLLSGFRWDLFWPVVLIAIGLLILARRR